MNGNRQSRSSPGFTLIEIVVVVLILSLLVALLLPAVQSAREAARNIKCISNLKQLAIAENTYQSVHGMFTPSQLKTSYGHSSNYMSEHVFLLPYLDQSNVYNSINFTLALSESRSRASLENKTARSTNIAVFLCPSDVQPKNRNSYRFNRGIFGGDRPGAGHNGPFSINLMPTAAAITDGLSNTALATERIAGTFEPTTGRFPNDIKLVNGGEVVWRSDGLFVPYCDNSKVYSFGHDAGKYWFFSSFSDTHYNHYDLPNSTNGDCGLPIANDNGFGRYSARSQHRDHVNVMFGDGHVSAVTNTIGLQTWRALGTYNRSDIVINDL